MLKSIKRRLGIGHSPERVVPAVASRRGSHTHYAPLSYTCAACMESYASASIIKAPCGHYYCSDCLDSLFESSLTDHLLFPPRCCRQRIPLDVARPHLSRTVASAFAKQLPQHNATNPTLCHSPYCTAFIPSWRVRNDVGTCLACYKRTCSICKTEAHPSDCPDDTALGQLLNTAEQSGWQRCYKCRRVVERDVGCSRMTYVPTPNATRTRD